MMKVLQVGKFYPPRWGGMETALKDICESIRDEVDLRVVVANGAARTSTEVVEGVCVTRLASWGTWFSQPVAPGLYGAIRGAKADLVHLHEPNPLAVASFLASGCRSRLIVHYHSDVVRQRRLRVCYRPILEAALRRAEAIIVGSSELMEGSPVLAGFRSKCVVIPFGIDLRPFLPLERACGDGGPPVVLAVGRLSYYKGFHHLIEAMRNVEARLVIVGEGEMRGELDRRIMAHGLAGRVVLAGRASFGQLLEWYRRADIFCLPSCERSEAFGLVMVEAMAAGLPVVSTDLPTGVRAVNAHGESGLVAPPGDPEGLAAALRLLVAEQSLRRRMGSAGRLRAQRQFSRELMGRRILKLYRSVACPAAYARVAR